MIDSSADNRLTILRPADQLIRDRDVAARLDIARSTLWKWVADGIFPKPLRLGPRAVRWRVADLEAWISRAAAGR